MSRQLLAIQVTFFEGIQERRVQDLDYTMTMLKWESPQMNSVLYMENFDHTRIDGAILKRPGWALLRPAPEERDRFYYGLNPTNRWPEDYPYTDPEDHIGFDLDRFSASSLYVRTPGSGFVHNAVLDGGGLIGFTAFPYSRPTGQEIILAFVRDHDNGTDTEVTRCVSFNTDRVDDTEKDQRWREPHINNPVRTAITQESHLEAMSWLDGHVGAKQPHPFPGWLVKGCMSDMDRHGGEIVFSAILRGDDAPDGVLDKNYSAYEAKDLYPVYIWGLWDLTHKRQPDNLFWNITPEPGETTVLGTLTDNYRLDNQYSVFKVRYPSMSVNREEYVSFKSYVYDDCFEEASLDNTIHNALMTDVPVNPIEICIIEQKDRVYDTTGTDTTDVWPDAKTYSRSGQSYLKVVTDWKESSESLRLEDPTFGPGINIPGSADWHVHPPGDDKNLHIYGSLGRNGTYWNDETITVMVGIDIIQMNVWGLVGGAGLPLPDELSVEDERIAWGKMHTPAKPGYGTKGIKHNLDDRLEYPAYWVMPVRIPNYIDSRVPRPWIKGEKIPIVVTMRINGIEVFVAEHVHVVEREPFKGSASRYAEYNQILSAAIFNAGRVPKYYGGGIGGGLWEPESRFWYDAYRSDPQRVGAYQILHPMIWGYQNWTGKNDENAFDDTSWVSMGDTFNIGGQLSASSLLTKWHALKEPLAYCWEPFNPTIEASTPYDDTDYTSAHACMVPDKFRAKHDELNMIFMLCKIKKTEIDRLLDLGLEEIRVYVAKPDSERSILRSQGLLQFQEVSTPGLYAYPITENTDDLSQYRLVQSFVLDGKTEPYFGPDDAESWRELYWGERTGRRNSWWQMPDFLISVAQDTDGTPVKQITPDFLLWDLPQSQGNPQLVLDSSGEYWPGRGASLITIVKGRAFIGGCIDEYGQEEQGVVRYSDVQAGVISRDVFSKENILRLGAHPHTALVEYREQLWAFSDSEIYRMALDNIGDITTWEILEKIEGQGTFTQKTVVVTPFGVVWANGSGVWLSDGRMPQNLAETVPALYDTLATGKPYPYDSAVGLADVPAWPQHKNHYLEVAYDPYENEIIVSTPVAQDEVNVSSIDNIAIFDCYDLVYSFDKKSWRMETIKSKLFNVGLSELNLNGITNF